MIRARLSPAWPDVASPAGSPVVLLLHGLGSDEHDLPSLAPWLPAALAWASLRAPIDLDFGGATWFPFDLPVAPGQQPSEPDQGAIDAATTAIWDWVAAQAPAHAPIVTLGFSQGGLMALQLLRTHPERIAATVVLSGLVAPAEQPADSALAESHPPVFWGRGDRDTLIWPEAIERTAAWLPAHSTLTARVYAGLGHSVSEDEMGDVRAFLNRLVPSRGD